MATLFGKNPPMGGSVGSLEDVPDVNAPTPSDKDTLIFDSASSEWGNGDHGDLGGLSDDDHTQYVLADGSRAFSAVVVGVDPTLDSHLATKGYVDGAAPAPAAKGFAVLTMSADQVSPAHGSTVQFDTRAAGTLTHSAVNCSVILEAGKTYRMEAHPAANWTGAGVNYAEIEFWDLTNSVALPPRGFIPGITSTSLFSFSAPVTVYTVGGSDIEVCIRKVTDGGTLARWWATSTWGSKAVFQEV